VGRRCRRGLQHKVSSVSLRRTSPAQSVSLGWPGGQPPMATEPRETLSDNQYLAGSPFLQQAGRRRSGWYLSTVCGQCQFEDSSHKPPSHELVSYLSTVCGPCQFWSLLCVDLLSLSLSSSELTNAFGLSSQGNHREGTQIQAGQRAGQRAGRSGAGRWPLEKVRS
jgi:hypothetical protein